MPRTLAARYAARKPRGPRQGQRLAFAIGPHSAQGRAFLKSAIELGLQLGQTVVAEGVETEIERALVTELGCQVGQGYLFARPMRLDALDVWTSARAVRTRAGDG